MSDMASASRELLAVGPLGSAFRAQPSKFFFFAEAETRIFELQTMYVDGAECDFGIAQAGAELFILPSVLSTRPIPTQAKVFRFLRGPNA